MDGHRDAQPDVAGIDQCQPAETALFGKQREDGDRHGKGNGRMRRRPAPKHPAPQPAKPEIMADVRTDEMFLMHPPRERLVSGRQQRPDERRLPDGPAGQRQPRATGDEAGKNQDQRHRERHESADGCRGKHPFAQKRTARGTEIKPIKPGLN